MPVKGSYKDLAGRRIRSLVVVSLDYVHPVKGALWLCLCDCGKQWVTTGTSIRYGSVTSCGCQGLKRAQLAKTTHGASRRVDGKNRTPEYRSWAGLRNRCNNPSNRSFHDYGARGITVCERWNDFAAFYSDMGPRPAGTSIERINNDLGYSPSNCCWATRTQQNRNTRRNRFISINGKKMPISQAAEEMGISKSSVRRRFLVDRETAAAEMEHA
jgi:hypothetical protein